MAKRFTNAPIYNKDNDGNVIETLSVLSIARIMLTHKLRNTDMVTGRHLWKIMNRIDDLDKVATGEVVVFEDSQHETMLQAFKDYRGQVAYCFVEALDELEGAEVCDIAAKGTTAED
jgi:hypothetical protein